MVGLAVALDYIWLAVEERIGMVAGIVGWIAIGNFVAEGGELSRRMSVGLGIRRIWLCLSKRAYRGRTYRTDG